jgi:hypothetical protein
MSAAKWLPPRCRRLAPAPLRMPADPARFVGTYVLAGCAPGRLVRIIEGAHGEENSIKALQELNKPLELHLRDTLDRDPPAELCPGST